MRHRRHRFGFFTRFVINLLMQEYQKTKKGPSNANIIFEIRKKIHYIISIKRKDDNVKRYLNSNQIKN